MKKLMMTSAAALCMMSSAIATPKDSATFYYVVQNPKFFGLKEARSWFEISGVSDKAVEKKINDYLKTVFFEKTELDTGSTATLMRGKKPKGYTDYTFWNGQTYGNGYIRFKDSDSLLYLTHADGYYGSGSNLGGMWQAVAKDKIGFLGLDGDFSNMNQQYTFSLVTGELLPNTFTVSSNKQKKNELQEKLDSKAEFNRTHIWENWSDCAVVGHDSLRDSVQVTALQLTKWLNGSLDSNEYLISLSYDIQCVTQFTDHQKVKLDSYMRFEESLGYITESDIERLRGVYLD